MGRSTWRSPTTITHAAMEMAAHVSCMASIVGRAWPCRALHCAVGLSRLCCDFAPVHCLTRLTHNHLSHTATALASVLEWMHVQSTDQGRRWPCDCEADPNYGTRSLVSFCPPRNPWAHAHSNDCLNTLLEESIQRNVMHTAPLTTGKGLDCATLRRCDTAVCQVRAPTL